MAWAEVVKVDEGAEGGEGVDSSWWSILFPAFLSCQLIWALFEYYTVLLKQDQSIPWWESLERFHKVDSGKVRLMTHRVSGWWVCVEAESQGWWRDSWDRWVGQHHLQGGEYHAWRSFEGRGAGDRHIVMSQAKVTHIPWLSWGYFQLGFGFHIPTFVWMLLLGLFGEEQKLFFFSILAESCPLDLCSPKNCQNRSHVQLLHCSCGLTDLEQGPLLRDW